MGVCCPEPGATAAPPVVTQPTTILPSTTTTATAAPTTASPPPPPPTTLAPIATTSAAKKGCGELMKQAIRIVGGQPADVGEWPWMAALLRDKTDQYCGGVLVTDQHILTASHCVDKYVSFNQHFYLVQGSN